MASTTWIWMGMGIVIAVFANLVVFAGVLPVLEQTPLLIGKDSVIVVGLLTMVLLLVLGFFLIYKGMMARSGVVAPSSPKGMLVRKIQGLMRSVGVEVPFGKYHLLLDVVHQEKIF